MAGVLDFVRLALDATGKRILNLKHADVFGAGLDGFQQLTGVMDPDDPTIVAKVATGLPAVNAAGQVIREVPDNFDSTITTLPAVLTEVTPTTTRARAILLSNLTASVQLVTVTNTAGKEYLKNYPLQAGMTIVEPLHGAPMVGIKWQAGNASAVNAQIWGKQ